VVQYSDAWNLSLYNTTKDARCHQRLKECLYSRDALGVAIDRNAYAPKYQIPSLNPMDYPVHA
jgi:hypothetical protein